LQVERIALFGDALRPSVFRRSLSAGCLSTFFEFLFLRLVAVREVVDLRPVIANSTLFLMRTSVGTVSSF
jgi:hypothetical protein